MAEKVEVVIKIPKYYLMHPQDYNCLAECVRRGTPLPKGHGRLIDVNNLLDRIGLEDNENNREDNVGEIITLEDFDYIPTIIEADTESGGEE